MIRIGFIRWLVQVEMKPQNNGKVSFCFSLVPQAERYKSLVSVWTGLRKTDEERETNVEIQTVARSEDRWEYRLGWKQMELAKSLADELACLAVNYCIRVGIIDANGMNVKASKYLVRQAILNNVTSGQSDAIERVPFIDLVPDMRAVREERQRQAEAARQRNAEIYARHNAEMAERQAARNEATKVSFDMLYALLNSVEREEAKSKGQVTVKTLAGTFVVPITAHGLVKQYNDKGEYVHSLCVVFQDYSIPVGDEALMKIALLKTDPKKFFDTANKFIESGHGRLRHIA